MNDDFEHNFWSSNGIDVVLERLQHSKHSCQALEDYFKERAKLSEEYGGKLLKLSKLNLGGEDIGSLQSALEILAKETEAEAQAHLDFASMFKERILRPFSEFHTEQQNRKRNQRSVILKANKEQNMLEANVEKLKERYVSKCKEKDAMIHGKPSGLAGKEQEKYEVKLKKVIAQSETCDQEYLSAVMKTKTSHSQWVETHRNSCREFEGLESARFDKFLETLSTFLSELESLSLKQNDVTRKIKEGIAHIDKGKDLKAWVRANQTGNTIPQPPEYFNYYTGSSSNSTGNNNPDATSSSQAQSASAPKMVSRVDSSSSPNINNPNSARKATEQLYLQSNNTGTTNASLPSGISTPGYASSGDNLSEDGEPGNPNDVAWKSPITSTSNFSDNNKKKEEGLFEVRVLYDYAPQTDEDLELVAEQIVKVLDISDDPWWFGQIKNNPNKKGVFPSNFVEKLS